MTALTERREATFFTPPSVEYAAASRLGLGPVLALDVNDERVLSAFADRAITVVSCNAARRRIAAEPTGTQARLPPVPSILIGDAGAESHAELKKTIAWALDVAAPCADFAVVVPAHASADERTELLHIFRDARCVVEEGGVPGLAATFIIARRANNAPVQIRYEGTCDERYDGSLAFVNRQLLSHIREFDPALRIASCADPLHNIGSVADITVRHYWPPVHTRPQTRYFIHMQPWEFGSLPASWRDGLRNVDEVWCYTEYVADIYRRAEFPSDRIFRLPLGFNPMVFHPRVVPASDECIFTFVGGLIQRKGADLAIAAFARAFTGADNVRLIIKSHGAATFYSRSQVSDIFAPLNAMTNAPRYTHIDAYLSESEIALLYARSAAALVPFRGEGFGLPALEAMACGTPVVYTRGGALDDFCNAENGFPINSKKVMIHQDSLDSGPLLDHGFFVEADIDDMARQLRAIYTDRAEAIRRGGLAAQYVHNTLTWEHAAIRMHARLREIATRLGNA